MARKNTESPSKDTPKKTRGIIRTEARPQSAPQKSEGFFKHSIKGKC